MPPTGEPYRVANARDAEPFRDGHGIVFRRPNTVFRNVMLEAEPIRAGRAVPPPIKARMIGENLDARALNIIKKKLKKCSNRSHKGKPEYTASEDGVLHRGSAR
jgi:hypothetical protein